MLESLKKRSAIAYLLIAALFLSTVFIQWVLVESEKDMATIVNVSGKQRMFTERLLAENHIYHTSRSESNRKTLLHTLEQARKNYRLIKSVPSDQVQQIIYGEGYRFDYYISRYFEAVERVVSSGDQQSYDYIRYGHEYILDTADAIVTVFADEYHAYLKRFQYISLVLMLLFFVLLFLLYNNVTLTSINRAETLFKQLEESQQKLDLSQKSAKLGTWSMDVENFGIKGSKAFYALLGLNGDEEKHFGLGPLSELLFEEDLEKVMQLFDDAINFGMPFQTEFRIQEKEGFKSFKIVTEVSDGGGDVNGLYGSIQDITETVKQRNEMRELLDLVDRHIITSKTDKRGVITQVSQAFSDISGYRKEELLGQNHRIVRHPDMPDETFKELWQTVSQGDTWQGEIKNLRKDGSYYWVDAAISPRFDETGDIVGYMAIRQDITNKKRIEQLSITDGLTSLYNRRHFNNVAPKEIDRVRRNSETLAFILLDVDNFKKYNDTYGHQEGDHVLTSIAKALQESFQRSGDLVFRLGGEEFGVLYSVKEEKDIAILAEQAREAIEVLNIPHKENPPGVVTASFGVIVVPTDGKDDPEAVIEQIYKAADEALYEAKENGRNRICLKPC